MNDEADAAVVTYAYMSANKYTPVWAPHSKLFGLQYNLQEVAFLSIYAPLAGYKVQKLKPMQSITTML